MPAEVDRNETDPQPGAKKSWKKGFDLPVGASLSAQRQVEVMTAKLGSTPERNSPFPCEQHIQDHNAELFRGESIETPADVAFRALQQTIAGSSQVQSRLRLIRSFDVLEVKPGEHVTFRLHFHGFLARTVVEAVATYLVVPRSGVSCRLLAKALVCYGDGWAACFRPAASTALTHYFRRELLKIKGLAEGTRPGPVAGIR